MPATETQSMTSGRLVEEFREIFNEALRDAVSDLPLAPILIESNFFAIRNAQDQEAFFATSTYLDEFLLSTIPATVTFNEDRLALWAKEALDFARQNASHDTFIEIFSLRLQYEPVIQNLLQLDASGRFLKDYFRQVRIESAYLGDVLPAAFLNSVEAGARSAIQPTLLSLAHQLKAHANLGKLRSRRKISKINEIRTLPSFINEKGTIPFAQQSGKFRIQEVSELEQIAQYRPVMDRAIRKLIDARTFQRIGNKDPVLAGLLSEYKHEFLRPTTESSIPLLWMCGLEIEERIARQDEVDDADERLEAEDLVHLRRLLLSHNLFLNCYNQSASLLRDVESSAAIYQRMDSAAKRLSPTILRKAAGDLSLVEEGTAATILRSISRDDEDGAPESKGGVAIKFGLLRGLLHAIGGYLLSGIEKIIEKSIVDVTSKALLELLRANSSFAAAIAFLLGQTSALVQLSGQAPIYFGYIKNLLTMLGLHG